MKENVDLNKFQYSILFQIYEVIFHILSNLVKLIHFEYLIIFHFQHKYLILFQIERNRQFHDISKSFKFIQIFKRFQFVNIT